MQSEYPPPLAPPFADLPRENALQGPAGYFFSGEDAIQIDALSSAAVTLTISGIMLGANLQLIPFSFTVVTTGNAAAFDTARVGLDSGWLQHLRVRVSTGFTASVEVFVYIRVCRGLKANAILLGTLTSGYAAANHDLYWPQGITERPTDSAGVYVAESQANPGAGNDWTFSIPASRRFQIVALSALFTTSGVAGNRQVRLLIDDGTNIVYQAPAPAAATAGVAWRLSWGQGSGGPVVADPASMSSPIPNTLFLPGGFRVRTLTGGIDPADAWTLIRLLCNEYIDLG